MDCDYGLLSAYRVRIEKVTRETECHDFVAEDMDDYYGYDDSYNIVSKKTVEDFKIVFEELSVEEIKSLMVKKADELAAKARKLEATYPGLRFELKPFELDLSSVSTTGKVVEKTFTEYEFKNKLGSEKISDGDIFLRSSYYCDSIVGRSYLFTRYGVGIYSSHTEVLDPIR